MSSKYDDLSREELATLLQARDKRDATRFGLVWEANEIERDQALNEDFVALDLDPSLSCGDPKEAVKAAATHGTYGNILVLNLDDQGGARDWYAVRYDESSERAFRESIFRLDLMRTF